MSGEARSIMHSEIVAATTNSTSSVDIPGLTLDLGSISPPALITLNIPLFFARGFTATQDQGVIFYIYYRPNRQAPGQIIARGGYSFYFQAQGIGRLPICLTGYAPEAENRQSTIIQAGWNIFGQGVTAVIDSLSTMDAILDYGYAGDRQNLPQ